MSLKSDAQYFNVTAQLQGSGNVSCKTDVSYTDSSGSQKTVSNSGTAQGGYNIASAEICSSFDGGWESC